ncbi:diversity-generating retroelement protein Avd [Thiomicrorhabdus sp.]|uniref:diversity-generating retroelement protein Avd n=1 Tax=Thiomicrorhabdus sp. TaxID=2039724 RepID=UPI0029C8F734|nr:diversity-generating retroelement protein Avd [Thiomicrorhabdus sp.]
MAKLEDLDAYSHLACHQFPKIERHVLASAIRQCLIQITETAITAFKRKQKTAALFDLDVKVAVLKHLVRKSYALHYINDHKFHVWSGHVLELGRMVGGWLKHESAKEKKG